MAGMFYSLQEVAEKLNKTEEEVKEIIKQGKLREFRDGPNLLFKVDEVEALMSDTSITASKGTPSGTEQETDKDDISLVSETTGASTAESELTGADTALAGEETNVPGKTDSDYQMAEDTVAETAAASGEASLEKIEEDVNLDTFGSGSGLLDLSLQADDTSLGGILDEIYTPEGKEDQDAGTSGPAMEVVAAEAEQMLPGEELAATQPSLEAPAMVRAYIEPVPDTLSNALGIMLFLPLLAIVYTAIVAVAGFNDVMPAILEKIQGIIWYIAIGAAVAAIAIVGVAFTLSGSGGKPAKKAKARKPKNPKAKKTPQPAPETETA